MSTLTPKRSPQFCGVLNLNKTETPPHEIMRIIVAAQNDLLIEEHFNYREIFIAKRKSNGQRINLCRI